MLLSKVSFAGGMPILPVSSVQEKKNTMVETTSSELIRANILCFFTFKLLFSQLLKFTKIRNLRRHLRPWAYF
jgi:hypothetical protein